MDIGHLICFSLILEPKKESQTAVNEDWGSERAEVYWSNTPRTSQGDTIRDHVSSLTYQSLL